MLDRFLGRPKARPLQSSPRTPTRKPEPRHFKEGVTCRAGCGKTYGYRCSYKDMTGRRCTYWCPDHSVFLNGRMWCERHANSIKWLRARDGSIYEIGPVAAIDDRSPNLVGILVEELNDEMTAYLTDVFSENEGVYIVTDGHVRTAAIPQRRVEQTPNGPRVLQAPSLTAWERGWGVYSHVGYLARVVLRVTSTEPPVVYVYANGALVLTGVPDWIANRGKGTDPRQEHANFRHAVMQAIKKIVVDRDDEE